MKILQYYQDNKYVDSKTKEYYKIYNPSNGEQIAELPRCTLEEVRGAIDSCSKAYKLWSEVPVMKRQNIMYKVVELMEQRIEELTLILSTEQGKVLGEARGDVLKAIEGTRNACSVANHMMGDSLMNVSSGFDTVLYRESLGVFAGIVPFNFPAMIPMGWMLPMCVATGNCMLVKVSSSTPMTALKMVDIYREAGVPAGVVNVISCDRVITNEILSNPIIKGISFVGSTAVGKYIYETAAKYGKRVQTLCEAKNHALVTEDAAIARSAAGIINASFGCAGERCMALPVIVAVESIDDELVYNIKALAKKLTVGPAYNESSKLGPLYTSNHKESVLQWIEKGIEEGAELILDGRDVVVSGYEKGFYVGATIFDRVTEDMSIGQNEIFGPVLCIKRVKDFEEGLKVMNSSIYGNGSVIYTQNGYYAREFSKRTGAGMVGINVGIPVPVGVFPFSGHKDSFFGDLHVLGKDGMRFYTESKCVTVHWFDEIEKKNTNVSTWDGTIEE